MLLVEGKELLKFKRVTRSPFINKTVRQLVAQQIERSRRASVLTRGRIATSRQVADPSWRCSINSPL